MFWEKYLNHGKNLSDGILSPGQRVVAYVRNSGRRTTDSATVAAGAFYTTIAGAWAACTAANGDVIVCLPGHSESIGTTTMTNAVSGVTIVGVGNPDEDLCPTLLWSGATSNLAVATKNITIANMRLLADADNITEAITVTAAGFKLLNCYIDAGIGSSTDAIIFCNVSTNGNDCLIAGCDMRATAGGETTMVKMATVVDNCRVVGNRLFGTSNSTTLGAFHVSAALTNLLIAGNFVDNQTASSTAAISFTDVACTGFITGNMLGVLANTSVPTGGIILAGTSNILAHFHENYYSDGVKGTSGLLTPTVTT
jgi:hypothetical protein